MTQETLHEYYVQRGQGVFKISGAHQADSPRIFGVHNSLIKSIRNTHGMHFFWVQHVGCILKQVISLWTVKQLGCFCVYLGPRGFCCHVLLAGTTLFIIIHYKDPYPIGFMYAIFAYI